MKTLDTQLDETLSTERPIAALSVVFGTLAMALAALRLYGVRAFVVMRRTREIGCGWRWELRGGQYCGWCCAKC
jgi:hypothetical protein